MRQTSHKECRPSLGFPYRYVPWSTFRKEARAPCQAVDRFPLDGSKRLVPIGIGAYKHVEKLWKKRLVGGLTPRSGPLINRLAHQQQWQFVLACGVAGHCLHGNHAAFTSVSQEAPKQCGLSPLQEPSPLPCARWVPRACIASSDAGPAAAASVLLSSP